MKKPGKIIFTEFNIIASPTPAAVRKDFEKEFDLLWTGWVGRYYDKLDTIINKELPRWLKRNYLIQHDNKWPFHQSGIVFVKDDYRIEILENNTHLEVQVPIIRTRQKFIEKFGIPEEMKYPFWFDIIHANSKNRIVSSYRLSPTPLGKKLLKDYGIPESFPAIIMHDSQDYKFYYFAGDFCDNPISLSSARFKWVEYYNFLSYEQGYQERVSFFWNFYRPLMRKIIQDYYDNFKSNKNKGK